MASWEPTIGESEADQINKGESLDRVLRYLDENGAARDLTGATFSVTESYPSSIVADMEIALISAAAGTVGLSMSAANMAKLGEGRVNWFRIKTTFPTGQPDVTSKIWIQIT